MDNATKRELKKQDKFVATTEHGIEWASQNRSSVVTTAVIVLAAILVVTLAGWLYNRRGAQASSALGEAMTIYEAPIANSGQPIAPGVKSYSSIPERAKAANVKFLEAANKYSMMHDGRIARYFAGLTYIEQGENKSAEDALKQVAGAWDSGIAALAKLALAHLYQQTGRDSEAITLYQDLTKANTSTVPSGLAQLQLAEMYDSEGKPDEAKKIYAKLKDSDKDDKGKPGPISTLASEKLNPTAAPQGPGL